MTTLLAAARIAAASSAVALLTGRCSCTPAAAAWICPKPPNSTLVNAVRLRVHLTRVIGHGAGEIEPADDSDTVDADFFSGLGELAIAAALGSEVDNYGARRHAGDHFLGDQHGRGFARDDGGGDDHIAFRDHPSEH